MLIKVKRSEVKPGEQFVHYQGSEHIFTALERGEQKYQLPCFSKSFKLLYSDENSDCYVEREITPVKFRTLMVFDNFYFAKDAVKCQKIECAMNKYNAVSADGHALSFEPGDLVYPA